MTNLSSLLKSNFMVEHTVYMLMQEELDRDLWGAWERGDLIGALLRYMDIMTVDFEASWDLEMMQI